jgi:hypothetical protein
MELLVTNYWYLLLPPLAALLGWLIHAIAIHFFFTSILPRKKKILASTIGAIAAREFANFKGLEENINDPRHFQRLLPVIDTHIDRFLNEKLKEEMPMISMFIGSKTTDKLKEVFIRELQSLFPQVIGQLASNLKTSVNMGEIVSKKINDIPSATFSKQAKTTLSAELGY